MVRATFARRGKVDAALSRDARLFRVGNAPTHLSHSACVHRSEGCSLDGMPRWHPFPIRISPFALFQFLCKSFAPFRLAAGYNHRRVGIWYPARVSGIYMDRHVHVSAANHRSFK
jgi:hypothetical protein